MAPWDTIAKVHPSHSWEESRITTYRAFLMDVRIALRYMGLSVVTLLQ